MQKLTLIFIILYYDASSVFITVHRFSAPPNAAPYQVSLREAHKNHSCGGVIVAKQWILTAAHCINKNNTYHILMGTNELIKPGKIYESKYVVIHPGWNGEFNDIGLIKTKKNIDFNANVQPITLNGKYISEGTDCTVTGWPMATIFNQPQNKLQKNRLITLKHDVCLKFTRITTRKIDSSNLCALFTDGGIPYKGYSGGPLVADGYLIALVSWALLPFNPNYPTIFTRVAPFIKWIELQIVVGTS